MPITAPSAPAEPRYWEDFPVGAEATYGGKTVSREEIIAFAQDFDPQSFHIDETAAQQSQFGDIIASGWHICAITMRMICDGVLLATAVTASPGVDKIRWKIPVRPDDTLRVYTRVTESRPSSSRPELGITRWYWEVLNQRDECVTEVESTCLIRRRPTDKFPAAGI